MKKIIGFAFALMLAFTGTAFAATSYVIPLDDMDPSVSNVTCASLGMGTKTLKKGSVGAAVEVLQDIMAEYGYYQNNSTGIFDTATISAVKEMQGDLDIKADGIVGPQTRAAMQEMCTDFVSGS